MGLGGGGVLGEVPTGSCGIPVGLSSLPERSLRVSWGRGGGRGLGSSGVREGGGLGMLFGASRAVLGGPGGLSRGPGSVPGGSWDVCGLS